MRASVRSVERVPPKVQKLLEMVMGIKSEMHISPSNCSAFLPQLGVYLFSVPEIMFKTEVSL